MKSKSLTVIRTLVVCALVTAFAAIAYAQDNKDKAAPQVSKGEQDAIAKIQSASDPAAKLKAGGEFVKKFPKSTQRAAVVSTVVTAINNMSDPAQKITLLENAWNVFNDPADADILAPVLLTDYINAKRIDDAFTFAAKDLSRNPNDLGTLSQMTVQATEQAKQKNGKFVAQGQQYGTKAIQIIESGNKPANMSDENWKTYQTSWLPQLYLATGLMAKISGNEADAKTHFEKAATLGSVDPLTYYLLGEGLNDEYRKMAEDVQKQSSGPLKDSMIKDAQAKLDEVIEQWAHALAVAQGNAQYDGFVAQLRPEVENYYTYRHGSTKGLDELIAKYKK